MIRIVLDQCQDADKDDLMTKFHRITNYTQEEQSGIGIEDEVSQEFLDRIPGGLFRYRAEGEGLIDYVSRDVLDMMGCETYAQFLEVTGNTFLGMVWPEDRERVSQEITDQISQADTDVVDYRLNRPDGRELWVRDKGRCVKASDGTLWFYVTLIDITELMAYTRKLEQANQRVELISMLSHDVVFDIQCQEQTGEVFGDFEARFNRPPRSCDFIVRKRCDKSCDVGLTVHNLDAYQSVITEGDYIDEEIAFSNADGEPVWCRYQSFVLFDKDRNPVRHVGRLLDTQEMAMREVMLRRQAELDGLTGLFNRDAAMVRIDAILCTKGDRPCTLFLIDADDFKQVNDNFGHPTGDRVLQEIAKLLKRTVRSDDIVVRLGGDEFAIFAEGLGAGRALDNLLHLLAGEIYTHESRPEDLPAELQPSITVGAVACTQNPVTFDELYQTADEALYVAKRGGKGRSALRMLE